MIQIQNQLPTKENDGLEELKRFCANTHTHTHAGHRLVQNASWASTPKFGFAQV